MFKKKFQKLLDTIGMVLEITVFTMAIVCLFLVRTSAVYKYDTTFDTTAIDVWCRGEDIGTVRMVGAWVAESEDNTHTLNDETGNAWIVEDITLYEDDWLLLWIADNHTPDNVEDDIIVKVWREAH